MKKSFWEHTARFYDAADKEAAKYIAGFLPKDCRLLEAACGTGRFSCALASVVRQVSCCDYAETMVRQTEKKAGRLGLANMNSRFRILRLCNGESGRSGKRFLRLIGSLGFQPENEWTQLQFLEFLTGYGLNPTEYRMFASKELLCVAIIKNAV